MFIFNVVIQNLLSIYHSTVQKKRIVSQKASLMNFHIFY